MNPCLQARLFRLAEPIKLDYFLVAWSNLCMQQNLLTWETVGALFIIITGILLHFAFEWSERLMPVALIAAVNESVWEHLKLAFWPSLVFAIIEYFFIGHETANFLPAETGGFFIVPLVIIFIFYSYTSIVGHSILFIDISTFVAAVVLGQLTSYRIMQLPDLSNPLRYLSIAALIVMIFAFSLFTYFPPHLALFQDSRNGQYGIPAER
jgi:Family of unknown function (DUF6512)